MFPRKYFLLLWILLPFISGFSDHWLRDERPWKKWPLQPKVAFSADVISRTPFGVHKGKIYFSPPGQLRNETFDYLHRTLVTVLNPDKGKLYKWAIDPSTGKFSADPSGRHPIEEPIEHYWPNVAVEGSYWVLPVNIRETSLVKEGDQVINGVETTRYKAAMDAGREVREAHVWIARKHRIIVRFETSPEGWSFVSGMEMSNLNVGNQDPALFDLPKELTKAAGPPQQPDTIVARASNIEGVWRGVVSEPAGGVSQFNAAMLLFLNGEIITGQLRFEIPGNSDRNVVFDVNGAYSPSTGIVSAALTNPTLGQPPAPNSNWCTSGTIELRIQPDEQLHGTGRGQAQGLPDCPMWTTTFRRSSGPL